MVKKIILVGSTHSEKGLSNSRALAQILTKINPQVIFEERSISTPEDCPNLESQAIRLYQKQRDIIRVPVDLDIKDLIDEETQFKIHKLFKTFESNDHYQELKNFQDGQAILYGFPFINSKAHEAIMEDMRKLEAFIVQNTNNPEMKLVFDTWNDIQNKRENAMISRINAFSSNRNFLTAVFLIGANHLDSIKNLIHNEISFDEIGIEWEFHYFKE